jgi:hypothetical protein
MNFYSKLRRTIVKEGNVYSAKSLFNGLIKEEIGKIDIDNPEFYDIETKTLKLGNLCADNIKKGLEPNISIGGKLYTTYCALAHLSNILEPSLVTKFHYNIDKLYNFLRRDLMLDNRRKFHGLMKTILSYDDPANTINIIVDFIDGTENVDEIEVALDRFRKSKDVGEEDIDKFLRYIKTTGHQEYEKSFYGEHFEKHTTRLTLKYKTEQENLSILKRVEDVVDGKYTVDKAVSILYKNIEENYSPEEMVKADLKCIKDVYNEKGDVVINSGEYLEVKKIDYAADSYLSEFMSMYKISGLPDYAKEPNYVKVYNQIIDGLFEKFSSRSDIIEDIKQNFAGIIYDDKIFISKDDIELYWSNKGRNPCSKDHRLSIRYRLKNKNTIGYVYEDGDVLKEKPVSVSLSSEKILCPITKSRVKESYNLNQISDLLLEGRKEDILKKYGIDEETTDIINYFSDKDPSGNNKYLEWMFKNWAGLGKNRDYSPLDTEVVDVIELFHKNIQRIKNKDINSYSFLKLKETVKEAEEKRKMSELKKEAKKQKTVIYDDDRWLVVSPHSWKASCYYGAGTKWCVTSKDTSTHWNNYSKNSTFFYIIDKTKTKKNKYYKVAYRQLKREGKFELWDAEDMEFSSNILGSFGRDWFDGLPEELKNKALIYHKEKYPKIENIPEWVEDDYSAQALVNHLSTTDISETDRDHYGLTVYEVDGENWCSAMESDVEDAVYEYFSNYSDEELIEYYDEDGTYIYMDDQEQFIDSEVDSYISDLSEEEILEITGIDSDVERIEGEIEKLRDELNDDDGEDEERVEDLEFEIESLEDDLESTRYNAKETLESDYRDDWEGCLNNGVVSCLVYDKGWYRSAVDLYNAGFVYLEKDALINSQVGYNDYEVLAPYGWEEEMDDDGDYHVVFKID